VIEDIAVIGLGKLGASMTGCLASRGFNVTGVDVALAGVALQGRLRPRKSGKSRP
jgi:3-hydroxyisobutyrate dehydrogenase-like beta-hydroxyacid dehydrogenase